MRSLPLDIGLVHFVGIGGIGMSGIAEVMHNLNYRVQGSDIAENASVRRLREKGIEVMLGHDAANVEEAAVVVVSSAVSQDNPEVMAARDRLVPVVRRAEMLAELMRLKWSIAVGGTHGKTTTTSLVAALLDAADYDPTVINGGIINAYGTNARLGEGEWMVVEADESDGTFVKLPATIAIVTNIDREHMDFYGTFDAERAAFQSFVENIPFYGLSVLCIDHPEVQAMIGRVSDRRIVTYGLSPQAGVRGSDVRFSPQGAVFDAVISDRHGGEATVVERLELPMFGEHNVQNALAAVAVAWEMGVPAETIRHGLSRFTGVKRRFTKTGEAGGVTVIDDYGHHPIEISAVLAAARKACQHRVVAIVQPHRFSRLHDLFEEFCGCFHDADTIIVADVYAAGEQPIPDVNRDALVSGLRKHGHRHVLPLEGPEHLAELVEEWTSPGDFAVCLGAGNITAWANELPEQLASIQSRQDQAKRGTG
ncbi:MAG: UDP-N-acetylmuramate--L-alanine ligase [Alphaproteobacteria bacterium]|nr:UDP-N-acetylmuramate--L-alanine ligase [Alphaproteobacteria bacterium]